MFHTNNFITKEAFPYEKTVHEHKAPTDDSIKILREMEEKLKANLVAMFTINNPFNAEAKIYRMEMHHAYEVTWALTLNGHTYTGSYKVSEKTMKIARYKNEWKKKMIEDVSHHLVTQMLGKVDPAIKTVFDSRSIL